MAYKPSEELKNLIEALLGPETEMFFECIGRPFRHTIRFNNLFGEEKDLADFLREQGFKFELFPGFENVYRLQYQPYPIGKSLSHFLGHFYVQDVSSMIPPLILDPQPGEYVLDMSAAPGSKTTQMAVMMQNKGMILANDIVLKRIRALINNLQRFGILNTAVTKNFGESLGNKYFETFDRVLLDPACSGLGTLHKTPEVLSWWSLKHCQRLASSQRQLLKSAVKAVKPGGVIVYSTCTLTPQENEEVIDNALSKFPLEVEAIDVPQLVTRPGLTEFNGKKYHPQLANTVRFYPFENQTEGFFVAKLRKTQPLDRDIPKPLNPPLILSYMSHDTSPVKKYLDYLARHFGMERELFSRYKYFVGKEITATTREVAEFPYQSPPVKTGLNIAHTLSQSAKLTTEGTLLLGSAATANLIQLPDLNILNQFVNREALPLEGKVHAQVLVKYKNIFIGYGLVDHGKLKSQFPKAEWPFQILPKEKESQTKANNG